DVDGGVTDLDGGWERDLFCHAVQSEICGDGGIGLAGSDGDGLKGGGWNLGHVKEVGGFQMPGQAVRVGPDRIHLSHDFIASVGELAVYDVNFAAELFESTVMLAGGFGSDKAT